MKKQIFFVSAITLLGVALTFNSCKKEDTTPPEVTLTGGSSSPLSLNASFTKPTATATDDEDGEITTITETGTVNKDSAGVYTLTFSATDAAGNTGSATYEITVVNDAEAAWEGTYTGTETDANGPYVYGTIGGHTTVSITASKTVNNRVTIDRLGDFTNNTVYMNITGTSITIPSQTHANVGTGSTSDCTIHSRQTDGTGAKTSTGFTLTYNDSKVAPCTGTRTGVVAVFTK